MPVADLAAISFKDYNGIQNSSCQTGADEIGNQERQESGSEDIFHCIIMNSSLVNRRMLRGECIP